MGTGRASPDPRGGRVGLSHAVRAVGRGCLDPTAPAPVLVAVARRGDAHRATGKLNLRESTDGVGQGGTMVGDIELSIRLPGSMRFGFVPISPRVSVMPGFRLKSCISSLSRKPVPLAMTREPYKSSNV